jgi:hypothetical protein
MLYKSDQCNETPEQIISCEYLADTCCHVDKNGIATLYNVGKETQV